MFLLVLLRAYQIILYLTTMSGCGVVVTREAVKRDADWYITGNVL